LISVAVDAVVFGFPVFSNGDNNCCAKFKTNTLNFARDMKRILISLSFLSLFISCRKNKSDIIQFPAETQSGLNTFGCYIDGQAFIPSTTLFGNIRPINVYYTPDSTRYYNAGFL